MLLIDVIFLAAIGLRSAAQNKRHLRRKCPSQLCEVWERILSFWKPSHTFYRLLICWFAACKLLQLRLQGTLCCDNITSEASCGHYILGLVIYSLVMTILILTLNILRQDDDLVWWSTKTRVILIVVWKLQSLCTLLTWSSWNINIISVTRGEKHWPTPTRRHGTLGGRRLWWTLWNDLLGPSIIPLCKSVCYLPTYLWITLILLIKYLHVSMQWWLSISRVCRISGQIFSFV